MAELWTQQEHKSSLFLLALEIFFVSYMDRGLDNYMEKWRMGESLAGIKTMLTLMECMVEKDSQGELRSDIDFHHAMKELIGVVKDRVSDLGKDE